MDEVSTDNVDIQKIESEEKDRDTKTATYKIITYGADMTLELLSNKIKEGEIIIPSFQRRYIWPPKKASKLIESFLLGLPIPQIFLYREEESQNLLVVDGQQRLKTILYFLDGKFENGNVFFLRGVSNRWEGKTYKTLTESERRKLKNSILRATIFEQTDPNDDTSMFEIFERLNTGGMALSQQEIRNCIYQGKLSKFLKELNEYENWRNLLQKPEPDSRMKDIEMILRFLALFESWKKYKKPMKEFINNFMEKERDINEKKRKEYSDLFRYVIDSVYENIGSSAFRVKRGINVAIFDSVMIALATVGPDKISNIKKQYEELLENASYLEYVDEWTTDEERVTGRIKIAIQVFS